MVPRQLTAATLLLCASLWANAMDVDQNARFAKLALACVHQEYPNKISHVLQSDADVGVPSALTPAFFGCYDWHSAVHGHWLLARLARTSPSADFAVDARAALARSLTKENVAAEVAYITQKGRGSFERPYGLAWLLQLATELDADTHPDIRPLRENLRPLEALVVQRWLDWLPKLSHPIRTGEHSQTAFAFGLAVDYARRVGHEPLADLLVQRGLDFYGNDIDCPLAYEPSGQDFLSPCLAEADFVRRLLPPARFAHWLDEFMPDIPTDGGDQWLAVAVVTDKSDGKLAHLDGLNLSRAWMLEGIAHGLPDNDRRREALLAVAHQQSNAGLRSVTGEDYAGGHWLASFATYLVTQRGLDR
ncbi:MAG: DUF2891 domain-containing protein [Gammaproteobacteria bacterium]